MELTFPLEVAGEIGNLLIHPQFLFTISFAVRMFKWTMMEELSRPFSMFRLIAFWLKLRFVQLQISFILAVQELFSTSDVPISPTFGRACKNFKFTESARLHKPLSCSPSLLFFLEVTSHVLHNIALSLGLV